MATATSTALAVMLGLGLALPSTAQEQQSGADADEDGFVTAEEAAAFDEQRFAEITGGADEMTQEQFVEVITGTEDPQEDWSEAKAGAEEGEGLSQEQWLQWRKERFSVAAGDDGQLEAEQYEMSFGMTRDQIDEELLQPDGGAAAEN